MPQPMPDKAEVRVFKNGVEHEVIRKKRPEGGHVLSAGKPKIVGPSDNAGHLGHFATPEILREGHNRIGKGKGRKRY